MATQEQVDEAQKLFFVLKNSESKSLLKKHLSKEVFEQLRDKGTSNGVSLADCIRSGCENLDSGTGCYAGDLESYTVFSQLFDGVVDEYHKGFPATAKHPAKDMDPSKLNTPNPDEKGEYIISTRIRVARNLKGYPLGPALTEEQRKEIEAKCVDALNTFEGDLSGKYYPLSDMDEKTRQQLVDDHFLFKKGDRFLESSGINKYWPHGRGIFHNDAKTFLVWVNEEDELRIISMQKGGHIGEVFTRLCTAVDALEKKLEFIFDDHLGFVSSCPTNLGTGMRASVHIKIPNASKLPNFKEICEQYAIQPRGIHGEHSESDTGVVDLSNKRRLGLSELECVQQMYDGVVHILKLEKELSEANNKKSSTEPEISRENLSRYREIFDLFDRKHEGCVTADNFAIGIRSIGHNPTLAEIDELLKKKGISEGQKIDFNTFSHLLESYEPKQVDINKAFRTFDRNGDGFIDKNELKKMMTTRGEPLTDEEVDDMLKGLDVNEDGKISIDEFRLSLTSGPAAVV